MDCLPPKNGCCREAAISGVLTVVVNLLFHSPVTFTQISNSFLVIVLRGRGAEKNSGKFTKNPKYRELN